MVAQILLITLLYDYIKAKSNSVPNDNIERALREWMEI